MTQDNNQADLSQVPERRIATTAFYGYQRRKRIPDGCMSEDSNMTTDEYPAACVRPPRANVINEASPSDADGDVNLSPYQMTAIKDVLMVDGSPAWLTSETQESEPGESVTHAVSHVWYKDRHWDLPYVYATPDSRLLAFGAGLFCPSSGHYIPDRRQDDIQTSAVAVSDISFTASFVDAASVPITPAAERPEEPEEGDYWYDSGNDGLYVYTAGGWMAVPVYNTQLVAVTDSAEDSLDQLQPGDVVKVTEGNSDQFVSIDNILVTWQTGDDDTVVIKHRIILRTRMTPGSHTLSIARVYPALRHAVVHHNRVWGCQYDRQGDKTVNEILASRLGDPLNWYSNQLLEEDAFAFTVGEPGNWTGAALLEDKPVFFKEHCMVQIYGDSPRTYTAVTTLLDGVQEGSSRSLCEINGSLYYLSRRGVMRLTAGGYPACISDALRRKNVWRDAVAGTDGRKYYIEMTDVSDGDKRRLYVYDTELAIWHTEDAAGDGLICFQRYKSELLAFRNTQMTAKVGSLDVTFQTVDIAYLSAPDWDDTGTFWAWLAARKGSAVIAPWDYYYPSKDLAPYIRQTGPADWTFATGDYGHVGADTQGADPAGYKRVKEIDVRYWKETGAVMRVYIMYDQCGTWTQVPVSSVPGAQGTGRVRYRLKRCDLFRLRFEGTGIVCVYSITQTYEGAGDRPGD